MAEQFCLKKLKKKKKVLKMQTSAVPGGKVKGGHKKNLSVKC